MRRLLVGLSTVVSLYGCNPTLRFGYADVATDVGRDLDALPTDHPSPADTGADAVLDQGAPPADQPLADSGSEFDGGVVDAIVATDIVTDTGRSVVDVFDATATDLGYDGGSNDDAARDDVPIVDAGFPDLGSVPQDGSCGDVLSLCDGGCVDIERDNRNCGACGRRCASNLRCLGGACAFLCDSERPCATPGEVCIDGVCSVADAGFADRLDASSDCGDTTSSLENCGGCGHLCALPHAITLCAAGRCLYRACDDGYFNCNRSVIDGCETYLEGDSRNCGTCGVVCGVGLTCVSGRCR